MPTPSPYERRQRAKINALTKRIKRIYEDAITSVVFQATSLPFKGELFSLANYPDIQKQVNRELAKLHDGIYTALINGIEDSWNLANEKNDLLVDKRLAGRRALPSVMQILYDPNKQALISFANRRERGLNLSDRVWNSLDPFKKELEQGLGIGIGKGQSAASMATEMKRYLNQPDKLFRRVRGEDGQLHLSKAARNYHPGQGVYRSSYQNARRLTRTETNIAYRYADHARWQNIPFIVGVEIRLSPSHKVFDICDSLKGKYPKDFKWSGWHPQCICNQVPIQLTDAEYDKYENELLGTGEFDGVSQNEVKDVPTAFDRYMEKEGERIAGYKRQPYWIKDNRKYV